MSQSRFRDTVHTRRLELQRFSESDADLMLAVWNDPDFLAHVGDRNIRTLDEAREALKNGILAQYREHGFGPYRVARRDDGQALGICGLFQRDFLDDPDIGFGLLPVGRRRGFAYEAACAVLEQARDELQLNRVSAIVSPDNPASIGLLEKLGLREERPLDLPDERALLFVIEF